VGEIPNAHFVTEPVQLLDESDLELFLQSLHGLRTPPVLIVFDTLARCFVGMDENAARDMGQLVDVAQKLQQEFGATIGFVHHTGKGDKDEERGSNALRGGCDTMIRLRSTSGEITLTNTKQKDHEEFGSIGLSLKAISLGFDEDAQAITSCVLEPGQGTRIPDDTSAGSQLLALRALAQFPNGAARSSDWYNELQKQADKQVPKRTYYNWQKLLLTSNFVEKLPDFKDRYRVTETGGSVLERMNKATETSTAVESVSS